MVFNSPEFLVAFLPIVFILFWVAKSKEPRYVILTFAGYIFYGWWNWRFCGLLLFSSLISFFVAQQIHRSQVIRVQRYWMALAVTIDLSILGFFKYFDFVARSVNSVAGHDALPLYHMILPLGISFYTFHTISYVVDTYAKRITPTRNLWEYLTYVAFFPQLVAGPIVRFRQIEQDLEHIDGPPLEENVARGIGIFVVGIIKKVVIADSLARIFDPLLGNVAGLSCANAWACAFGYTFQLYFDFSGYSDMAMGLGLLFGIRIPRNFDSPYKAMGIGDFWRRWHISLSSFLRDYLYIPLGGSRVPGWRVNVNLLIVMLLGGLWHGANWAFVIWGGYHGTLLIIDRIGAPLWKRLPAFLYRGITFMLVIFGWVLFRSGSSPDSFGMAHTWLMKMFTFSHFRFDAPLNLVLACAALLVAVNVMEEPWKWQYAPRRRFAVVYAVALFAVFLMVNWQPSVFLYYQF